MTKTEAVLVLMNTKDKFPRTPLGEALTVAIAALRQEMKEARAGKLGGFATAKKYAKRQRAKWGKLPPARGKKPRGRPRKDADGQLRQDG